MEERLVKDEQTDELYLSLTSTVALKRKKEYLSISPRYFGKGLTIDALVDSRAYVSAITQNEMDKKQQQQAQPISAKSTNIPIFKHK